MSGLRRLLRFCMLKCNARERNRMIREKKEPKRTSVQAKHCELNGIKFDSLAERDFYVRLCHVFGSKSVVRGSKVVLIEATVESPGIGWSPDFNVEHKGQCFIIEFKGCLRAEVPGVREFLLKWAILHSLYSPITTLRYLTFCDDDRILKWNTELGRKTLPSVFCSKNLTNKNIYELVDERFNLLNS